MLSRLKGQREIELEHHVREKELELERAKLERLKVEAQRQDEG